MIAKPLRTAAFAAAALALSIAAAPAALAQYDPAAGDWGKSDPTHLRVTTWNGQNFLSSNKRKDRVFSDWDAAVRVVATIEPDIIMIQEAGDGDSVGVLVGVADLFVNGGPDNSGSTPGGVATSYVKFYNPALDYPHVFVSQEGDCCNRNVILSRYPFIDLNGDFQPTRSDIYNVSGSTYAPGGDGGIRGYQFAEIDLPDASYGGDVVIGNGHLKAFGDSGSQAQRLTAAQNISYFIYHFYNGAGTGDVDPFNGVSALGESGMNVLGDLTPIILGGDLNEDEQTNGRRGPAAWLAQGPSAGAGDGNDADSSDMLIDDARDPFTNSRATQSSSKLDYLISQDSIANQVRAFLFNTNSIPLTAVPDTLADLGLSYKNISGVASDHRPVTADYILPGPVADPTGACCLYCDAGALVDCTELTQSDCDTLGGTYRGDGTACAADACDDLCPGDTNADGATDVTDFFALGGNFGADSGASRADGDLNCDGAVDVSDFFILGGDFGCVQP